MSNACLIRGYHDSRAQDLLDYVTYAGGVGRRRADAVSGVGASPTTRSFLPKFKRIMRFDLSSHCTALRQLDVTTVAPTFSILVDWRRVSSDFGKNYWYLVFKIVHGFTVLFWYQPNSQ